MTAARGTSASISTCSCRRMRAVADGAKAVECRHAERRREVAIGSAAGAALFELHADLRRNASRQLEQLDHARASVRAAGVRTRRVTSMRAPADSAGVARNRRLTRSASARVLARASMIARASSGTTFARVPPRMTPTVTVTPRAGSCNSSMAVICRASSRTALTPWPGSSPACADTTACDHLELADALAAGLQRSARKRRLEHQDRLATRGFGFDQRARRLAADLFIGRPQHHCPAGLERAALEHGPRGQRREADARFHVEHAGTMQPSAVALERHCAPAARQATPCRNARAEESAACRCQRWRAGDRRRW